MSHGGPGYFYYSYIYKCPRTSVPRTNTGPEEGFSSAVFSHTQKQDHDLQTAWFKTRAMNAIQADLLKWHNDVDGGKPIQERKYQSYNWVYVQKQEFKYCTYETLPRHTNGPKKGQPYGKEI